MVLESFLWLLKKEIPSQGIKATPPSGVIAPKPGNASQGKDIEDETGEKSEFPLSLELQQSIIASSWV